MWCLLLQERNGSVQRRNEWCWGNRKREKGRTECGQRWGFIDSRRPSAFKDLVGQGAHVTHCVATRSDYGAHDCMYSVLTG